MRGGSGGAEDPNIYRSTRNPASRTPQGLFAGDRPLRCLGVLVPDTFSDPTAREAVVPALGRTAGWRALVWVLGFAGVVPLSGPL